MVAKVKSNGILGVGAQPLVRAPRLPNNPVPGRERLPTLEAPSRMPGLSTDGARRFAGAPAALPVERAPSLPRIVQPESPRSGAPLDLPNLQPSSSAGSFDLSLLARRLHAAVPTGERTPTIMPRATVELPRIPRTIGEAPSRPSATLDRPDLPSATFSRPTFSFVPPVFTNLPPGNVDLPNESGQPQPPTGYKQPTVPTQPPGSVARPDLPFVPPTVDGWVEPPPMVFTAPFLPFIPSALLPFVPPLLSRIPRNPIENYPEPPQTPSVGNNIPPAFDVTPAFPFWPFGPFVPPFGFDDPSFPLDGSFPDPFDPPSIVNRPTPEPTEKPPIVNRPTPEPTEKPPVVNRPTPEPTEKPPVVNRPTPEPTERPPFIQQRDPDPGQRPPVILDRPKPRPRRPLPSTNGGVCQGQPSGNMWDVYFDRKEGTKTVQQSPIVLDLNNNGRPDITGSNIKGNGKIEGEAVKGFDLNPNKRQWTTKSVQRRPGSGAPALPAGSTVKIFSADGKLVSQAAADEAAKNGRDYGVGKDQRAEIWNADGRLVGELKREKADGSLMYFFGNENQNEWTKAWEDGKKGDAILAWDVDGDGKITSGKELFGEIDIDGKAKFKNGYEKLATYFDKNKDGVVSGAELDGLKVWEDRNGDAITQKNELFDITEEGVSSLNTSFNPEDMSSKYGKR